MMADLPLSVDVQVPAGGAEDLSIQDRDLWDQGLRVARDHLVAHFERRYLTWLLGRAAGNMSRAARIARVDRTTLYRLIQKHGLRGAAIISPR